tara:strand:+ start:59904 stop:60863 length:960 start_codon:yes stop_codon:yes gene_type:complete
MIALFLSTLLATATIQIFLQIKQMNQYQQGVTRIQENIQATSMLLGQLVRGAGDYGCNRLDDGAVFQVVGDIVAEEIGFNRNTAVEPTTYAKLAKNKYMTTSALARIDQSSDILWARRINQFFKLHDYEEAYQNKITVEGQPTFKQDDVVLLSDCQNMDVLKVAKNVVINSGKPTSEVFVDFDSTSQSLSKLYPPSAKLGKIESELIYVGNTLRQNQKGYPVYALYTTDLNGRTLELVEGVEKMDIQFCCDNNTKDYFSAETYDGTQKIKAIKFNFLLSSIEDALTEPNAYIVNNKRIMPKDKILRKWWSEEWAIRSAA